jgi:hypothetical protein
MWTGGQVSFRRVKVICVDLVSLIISRHFRVHCSILLRWAWMLIEAVVGFEWVAIIAVSSANVLRMVVEVCGISGVYIVYRFCIMSGVTRSGPGALRGWQSFISPVSSPKVKERGFCAC